MMTSEVDTWYNIQNQVDAAWHESVFLEIDDHFVTPPHDSQNLSVSEYQSDVDDDVFYDLTDEGDYEAFTKHYENSKPNRPRCQNSRCPGNGLHLIKTIDRLEISDIFDSSDDIKLLDHEKNSMASNEKIPKPLNDSGSKNEPKIISKENCFETQNEVNGFCSDPSAKSRNRKYSLEEAYYEGNPPGALRSSPGIMRLVNHLPPDKSKIEINGEDVKTIPMAEEGKEQEGAVQNNGVRDILAKYNQEIRFAYAQALLKSELCFYDNFCEKITMTPNPSKKEPNLRKTGAYNCSTSKNSKNPSKTSKIPLNWETLNFIRKSHQRRYNRSEDRPKSSWWTDWGFAFLLGALAATGTIWYFLKYVTFARPDLASHYRHSSNYYGGIIF